MTGPARYSYQVGDVVRMKKTHPCGSDCWEITRTGMDFGLKCQKCGRRVMIPRPKFEKSVKAVVSSVSSGTTVPGKTT